jgi:hypothetical protein
MGREDEIFENDISTYENNELSAIQGSSSFLVIGGADRDKRTKEIFKASKLHVARYQRENNMVELVRDLEVLMAISMEFSNLCFRYIGSVEYDAFIKQTENMIMY